MPTDIEKVCCGNRPEDCLTEDAVSSCSTPFKKLHNTNLINYFFFYPGFFTLWGIEWYKLIDTKCVKLDSPGNYQPSCCVLQYNILEFEDYNCCEIETLHRDTYRWRKNTKLNTRCMFHLSFSQKGNFWVEKIIDFKRSEDSKRLLFHIKWVDYKEWTWEPSEHLQKALVPHQVGGLRRDNVGAQWTLAKGSCSTSSGWGTKGQRGSPVNTCKRLLFHIKWLDYKETWEPSEHLQKAPVPHQVSGLQRNMGSSEHLAKGSCSTSNELATKKHGSPVNTCKRLLFNIKWDGYVETTWEPSEHLQKGSCSTSSGWTTKKQCGSPVNTCKGSCSTSSGWVTKKQCGSPVNTCKRLLFHIKWVGYKEAMWEPSEHLQKAPVQHQEDGYVETTWEPSEHLQKAPVQHQVGWIRRDNMGAQWTLAKGSCSTASGMDMKRQRGSPVNTCKRLLFNSKWDGYEETTWEPSEHLPPSMVHDFLFGRLESQ